MTKEHFEKLRKYDLQTIQNRILVACKKIFPIPKSEKKSFEELHYMEGLYFDIAFSIWLIHKHPEVQTFSDVKKVLEEYGCDNYSEEFESFERKNSKEFDILLSVADEFSNEEMEAYITFHDISRYPKAIAKLANQLLNIQEEDSVALLELEDYQYWIEEQMNCNWKTVKIGIDSYSDKSIIRYKAVILGIVGIDTFWPDDRDYNDICVNKVFVNNTINPMPYNFYTDDDEYLSMQLPNYPQRVTASWDNVGVALAYTKNCNGKAVVTINGGELTAKLSEKVRTYLIQNGYVEGVIVLADKIFPDIWLSPYMLILSHGNTSVKFMDARDYYVPGRDRGKRLNTISDSQIKQIAELYNTGNNVVIISNKDILDERSNLNPERYMEKPIDSMEVLELGRFMSGLKRGMMLTGAEIDATIQKEPTDRKCILPMHIEDGLITTCCYTDAMRCIIDDKYYANVGDLVITKSGNPFRVAVCNDRYAVIGNVYILRVRDGINPYYLKCYLESQSGQSELLRFATGAKTPIISIENLKKVRIPIFSDDWMRKLGENAEELTKTIEYSYQEIAKCRETIENMFEKEN